MTIIRDNFADVFSPGLHHSLRVFLGLEDPWPEWKYKGFESEEAYKRAFLEAQLERSKDPEAYDRLTEGMMPRIPR
jgi:hypothetical protein